MFIIRFEFITLLEDIIVYIKYIFREIFNYYNYGEYREINFLGFHFWYDPNLVSYDKKPTKFIDFEFCDGITICWKNLKKNKQL